MNRLLLTSFFVLSSSLLFSCDKDEDYIKLPPDPNSELVEKGDEIGIKINRYMDQASAGVSVQGADCYGDYLFQFQHANAAVFVYDLKNKEFMCKVDMKAKSQNHCNNVSFSRIFYEEGDGFPLLYVSGSQNGTYNQVQVYRITRTTSGFSIEQVQEIVLPEANPENYLYWTGVIMDNDNNFMYIYGNTNGAQIAKLYIPDIHQEEVMLSDDDIIERYTLEKFFHQQGAVISNKVMYVFDGVPAWGDTNLLRIIDIGEKKDIAIVNIMRKGFGAEAEGAFFYKGELYCATNNSGIFKVSMK